ncbi:hypothetical protein ACLOAU_21375 [Niabella sp. CJ426]|uniref:hypothetical protein n=1 Tax=Niabella sp. CJ426 TaxID=3393740 RepID=UPI003D03101B
MKKYNIIIITALLIFFGCSMANPVFITNDTESACTVVVKLNSEGANQLQFVRDDGSKISRSDFPKLSNGKNDDTRNNIKFDKKTDYKIKNNTIEINIPAKNSVRFSERILEPSQIDSIYFRYNDLQFAISHTEFIKSSEKPRGSRHGYLYIFKGK